MQLRTLLSPTSWAERALEQYWRLHPNGSVDPVTLTWPVDRAALETVRIRWPNRRSYAWAPRAIWGDQLRDALRRFVRVDEVDLPQPFDRVILVELTRDGRRWPVAVETSDYAPLNEDAYRAVALHFKMEYALEGYGERDHLVPGGYVNNDASIYRYLPRLRALRDHAPPEHEVHGRFGLSLEKRRRPMEILRASRQFRFFGGEGKVGYRRFLEEVARSKVCIDLPSMSSITFRMVDYLAIGSCIVGPPHTNRLLVPFQDRVHCAYCRPDYEDLEEVCVHYLRHEDERRALVANSRALFDAYLHRDQLASYYLHECLSRLA
ncbi:MAG: glycosyltransferase [Gemmatimonadales bacterium]